MGKTFAVIMAGGVGTRFWPRSREKSPKQSLEIVGKGTMIQNTVRRMERVVHLADVFIVTNRTQKNIIQKQLPQFDEERILVEPLGRNTAPCIGLAALHIRRLDPEAVMIVSPADHLIEDTEEFARVMALAVQIAAESHSLLTVGIHPTHPETGYGYIQMFVEEGEHNPYVGRGVLKVKTFAEKPNLQTARQFLASGDFLWNSGMFVWRVEEILRQIHKCLPELGAELDRIDAAIDTPQYAATVERAYGVIRGISIDYGVMEKAEAVYVIPGKFGWSDIGSWDEVYRVSGKDDGGNSINGKVIQKDTTGTYIHSPGRLVATVGVSDLIIIDTEDALLVCKRGRSQDVKEISDYLRRKQMNEYL
ncbi:MAG: mannose-1-phosphate guanylyltransferase [Bacteroidota bacterium]